MNLWKWSSIKYGDHRTAIQLMQGERLQKKLAAALAKIPVVVQKRIVQPVVKEENVVKFKFPVSQR